MRGGMSGAVRDTLIRTKLIEMEESVQLVNYPRLKPWACPSIFLNSSAQDGVR